jgi:hypothetical protein
LIPETTTAPRPLSGRAVRFPRPLVTECIRIDATSLKRRGVLSAPSGNVWISEWQQAWHPPERIGYSAIWAQGRLIAMAVGPIQYREDGSLRWGKVTWVSLVSTRPFFGGARWWFQCPATVGDTSCSKRTRIIYQLGGRWGCRVCLGLSYESRRRHRAMLYEGITVPMARSERLQRDLASRSPRRKLRALCKLLPESTFTEVRDLLRRRKAELAADRMAANG